MLRTPDDHSKIELTQFHTPAAVGPRPQELPVNALGYRRIVRGPEGIIIGLAEPLGDQ